MSRLKRLSRFSAGLDGSRPVFLFGLRLEPSSGLICKIKDFKSVFGLFSSVFFIRFIFYLVRFSVDKMYLELNEDHLKKRLKIGPTIQEILDFKVYTLKS